MHNSCVLEKLRRMIVRHRSYSHKLPSFKPGLVQNNDEFSGVKVACKDLVFPLLHNNSMTDVQSLRSDNFKSCSRVITLFKGIFPCVIICQMVSPYSLGSAGLG